MEGCILKKTVYKGTDSTHTHNGSFTMSDPISSPEVLQNQILDQLDVIIGEAEQKGTPLEVDPSRAKIFELFVTAEAAGCVGEEAQPDLSADGICAALSQRWGLQQAAQASVANQTKIPGEHLTKMRSLWSVMRMWMEWTYAWERWAEFHQDQTDPPASKNR